MGIFNTAPRHQQRGSADPSTPASAAPTEGVRQPAGQPAPLRSHRSGIAARRWVHHPRRVQRRARRYQVDRRSADHSGPARAASLWGNGQSGLLRHPLRSGLPPDLTPAVAAGISVSFTQQHKPTDRAHRISITTPAGLAQAPGLVAHVDFGNQYVDDDGLAVAPIVNVSGVGGTSGLPPAGAVTSTGYDLLSNMGRPAMTANVQVAVQPWPGVAPTVPSTTMSGGAANATEPGFGACDEQRENKSPPSGPA